MCGRYDNLIPAEAYGRLFRAERLPQSNFPPRYNVAPTQDVPIVRFAKDGARELVMARWGLVPFWMKAKPTKPFINARAETVHTTGMFREAFAKRRCLVPASGFFEWQQRASGKQPYRFTMKDLEPFAFAGLWEFARIDGEDILSGAIIVGEPNPLVNGIHDRMPVILMPDDYDRWLDRDTSVEEARELLKPFPDELMQAYPVSRVVNSPKNDTEECIAPIEDQGEPDPDFAWTPEKVKAVQREARKEGQRQRTMRQLKGEE
jgi:putative SOS response-associated peptidase YedK